MENEQIKNPWFSREGEKWVEVAPGYIISNEGRVYSVKSRKILPLRKNSSGYLRAVLCVNSIRHDTFVHIKVVELFGDRNGKKIPQDMEALLSNGFSIDHVDRNKNNNAQSNLELVTHSQNCIRKKNPPILIHVHVVEHSGKVRIKERALDPKDARNKAEHFKWTIQDIKSLEIHIVTEAFGERSEVVYYPKKDKKQIQMDICLADLL